LGVKPKSADLAARQKPASPQKENRRRNQTAKRLMKKKLEHVIKCSLSFCARGPGRRKGKEGNTEGSRPEDEKTFANKTLKESLRWRNAQKVGGEN